MTTTISDITDPTGGQEAAAVRTRYGAELVDLETMRYGLLELARDMHESLVRSSFSPVCRDIQDCTSAIHMRTGQGWETIASREGAMQHAFTSQHIVNFVMDEWDEDSLQAGDTIFVNDPWRGAIHCADVNMLRPVKIDGRVEFVLHSTTHVLDLGGPVPGGFANGTTEHFEEQMKFPPTLLYAGGVPVRPAFNFLLENSRVPAALLGDLRALYGCLSVGENRVRELVGKHGLDAVRAGGTYAIDRAETSLRTAIAELEDGDYHAEEFIDEDGVVDAPVKLAVTVKVRGDSIEVDFSGTARQPAGNVGTAWCEATRCIQGIKMALDPHSPVNSCTLRPVEALLPVGSAVLTLPPSSCSNHLDIGSRNINMVSAAMAAASPRTSFASDTGNYSALIAGGLDERPGHEGPWQTAITPGGGWGGTFASDGLSFCTPPIGACRSSVWEHLEAESPLVPLQHEVLPDSAGAGYHRGGFGGVTTLMPLSTTYVTITGDRSKQGAPGTGGGGAGLPYYAWLVPADDPEVLFHPLDLRGAEPLFGVFDGRGRPLPVGAGGVFGQGARYQTTKISDLVLPAGSALRVMQGGGGGWGDPLTRPVEWAARDLADGLYSAEFLRLAFGVVTRDGGDVDERATRELRADLTARRDRDEWSVPVAFPTGWIV